MPADSSGWHRPVDVERALMLSEIRDWTGWSARRAVAVVGGAHGGRVFDVHSVVERVYLLSGRDPRRTDMALSTAPTNGRSAVEVLAAGGDASSAYLAALDVLRPRRTGLIVGDRPRRDERSLRLGRSRLGAAGTDGQAAIRGLVGGQPGEPGAAKRGFQGEM